MANRYRVVEFTEFIIITDLHNRTRETAGVKSYRTQDSPVNPPTAPETKWTIATTGVKLTMPVRA